MPPKESGKLPSSRTKMGEPSARRRSLGVIHRDKQAARQKEREETLSARDNLNHVGGGKTSNHQAPKSPSADPGQLPVSPASDSDSDSGSGSVFTESDEDSHSTVQGSRTSQKTPGKTPKPGRNLFTPERLDAILAVQLVGLASTIDQQPADAKSAPSQNPSETPGKTSQPSSNSQPSSRDDG